MDDDHDISETLAPKSDQLDAVDLLSGPRIFTVESATVRNGDEQPVSIRLREFPRVWRPGKSMRRVLAACWGVKSREWAGRQVELFCDPDVRFGAERVGGTRISRLSHIDGPRHVPLLVTRGKSAMYTVQPLTGAPTVRTQQQARELGHLLKLLDLEKPDEALPLMGQWLDRDVTTTKTLTVDECQTVLEHLSEMVREAEAGPSPESGALFPDGDEA